MKALKSQKVQKVPKRVKKGQYRSRRFKMIQQGYVCFEILIKILYDIHSFRWIKKVKVGPRRFKKVRESVKGL